MSIDTTTFKKILETELETITGDLTELGIHNPNNPADWIAVPNTDSTIEADGNLAADRAEDWDERRSTLALLETRYNNITRALNKIANGTFGVCEISGHAISEDRLNANPAARTCKEHLEDESSLS